MGYIRCMDAETKLTEEPAYTTVARQPVVHPDFGRRIASHSVLNKVIGPYRVVSRLHYYVYKNEDGFTVNSEQFPGVFGFGDAKSEAIEQWSDCLAHLRGSYGSLKDDEGTSGAIQLRDTLIATLVPIGN